MAIFEYKYDVCTKDVNNNREITNKTILGLLENAGSLHSDTADCGLMTMPQTRLSWVIIHWKVVIHRRAQYGETITIKTWVSGTKRLYTFRQYEFYDEAGNLITSVNSQWVLTHLENGMMSVPERIFQQYGIHEKTAFPEGNIMDKLKEPEEFASEYDFTVPCTYIDFNDHMNNIYYLDIAYQAMPIEIFKSNSFDEFEIMYRKECKLGDDLKCRYYFDGEYHIISVKSQGGKVLNAVIKLKAKAERNLINEY